MRDILLPIRSRQSAVSSLTLAAALCGTAFAAWLSQGALAFSGVGHERVALVPLSIPSALIVAGPTAVVWLAWRAGASLVPLCLLGLLALPWIPGSTPPASLIWSGPLTMLVWAAVAISLAASSIESTRVEPSRWLARVVGPHPAWSAGALACAIYAVAAWQVTPSGPEGDEPHYLIITQSLLKDGDLRIENNHRNGDYRAFYAGELPKPDYRRAGRNREIYSIHAPGLPVLVAPAFAIAGYLGVVVFLIVLASIGSALAWYLAWIVTQRADAAWFGWAAVTLSTSGIFHSFAVFPDGPGGLIALTGVWALLRAEREAQSGVVRLGPWWLHGAALAMLPWIHTRFVLIAAGLGALVLLRLAATRNAAGKAVAFLAIPAISAVCWIGFFIAIYGTPDPSAPYANEEGSASFIPGGLAGLFFDQRFGVFAYAPVLLAALAGLVVMIRARPQRRLGLELLFILIPYLLAVTHFAMWWGGTSAPGRFFVPMLPLMAIPVAVCWTAVRTRATRVTMAAALAATVFASCALVFIGGGRLAYNVRQSYALWLEWLNGATDMARGMPAWWRGSEMLLYRDTAIWLAVFGAAWGALRAAQRLPALRNRGAFAAAAAVSYAVAGMVALSIVWRLAGADTLHPTPAQLELLRRLGSERNVLAWSLPDSRRVAAADVPAMLIIAPQPSTEPGGAGPNDRPLYQVASVPAGVYRLRPRGADPAGWLTVGIGRDQFSLRSGPAGALPQPLVLTFPVDVRAIVVRGDELTRRSLRALTIEPVSILPAALRLSDEYARRAVQYGTTTVFFLDERSFPEPEAFWIGGARSASVVLQPEAPQQTVALFLRNAPVDNRVVIASGNWREELSLAPGEEHRVDVPIAPQRGAALVTLSATAGFRPSAVDPNSRDDRFLGVWVRTVQ
jgi:hypothetical protein